MKIAVIAHIHYPIRLPYNGGLEAHTHQLVQELVRQGHDVTLFAKAGSRTAAKTVTILRGDNHDGRHPLSGLGFRYAMQRIKRGGFDLIFNNSLHPVPLQKHTAAMPPMITVFHTPPLPLMVDALRAAPPQANRTYLAVSAFTANQWQAHCGDTVHVVSNGIDVTAWKADQQPPATPSASWVGRITAEKGTDLAIRTCIAMGLPIRVGGVVYDQQYFMEKVKPLLGHPLVTYVGHADRQQVNRIYRQSSVALITPMWDEPFGLVAIEALASGTPVAALARGGLTSIITPAVGALARQDSPESLRQAIETALTKDRLECILYARHNFTLQKMVEQYLAYVPAMQASAAESLVWVPAQ